MEKGQARPLRMLAGALGVKVNRILYQTLLGRPDFRLKGCVGGSGRKDATRILSVAPGAISPRMQLSLLDKRYSPSTGMGLYEWEIVLKELIHAGYIVKKEPDDNH
jgi:hypothetical protein